MLRLERKTSEKIVINHAGETLVISLERARTGRAALGFTGNRNFQILRSELCHRTPGATHEHPSPQKREPHAGQAS